MTNQETAYNQIEQLIKRFKALSAAERRGMNEHATRQGYILPLFRSMGWNVDNINEVSPEEKVSRGWVDFSFRLGGIPRYFLETKKASEDLNDPRWVRQSIDYAWTKSVTWALLSDFEGLRVFNAEWKETDPFRAQFVEFDLDSYLPNFDCLWWLSREETLAGRLEREADKVGKRIKRLPVSQNLFDDLKLWRSELYKSLRQWNPVYSPAQIDEAVLRLLNRLIFIRTAEDREVEPLRLMPLLRDLENRHQLDKLSLKLAELFRQFDATYNSELFAPHFSEGLYCDRMPLEALIRGLYEKNFVRYNFNALEADVLGTAYEQYLGHIVTETQGETAQLSAASHVEEKRTKRKSQGIYYTPAFVTKYIVQQTVSRYLDENGYNPSRPPRILDMACGSGSFLIEAFDTLDRFVSNMRHQSGNPSSSPLPASPLEDTSPNSVPDQPGTSHLQDTSPIFALENGGGRVGVDFYDNLRRLELLQTCIFGVDKDKQAVDVARLNLLLRALHGRQKLPLLTNIYNADSLHPETWQQAFPDVMKEGGFDVIIGNPPYVRQETLGEEFKTFAQKNFETYAGTADLYIYFIEKAHKLLKPGGYFGMIVSNKWIRSNYGKALRDFLTRESMLVEIVDFGELPVFGDVLAYPVVLIAKRAQTKKQSFLYAPIKRLDFVSLGEEIQTVSTELDERALAGDNWTLAANQYQKMSEKIRRAGVSLDDYLNKGIFYGIKTGLNEAFVVDKFARDRFIADDPKSAEIIKPFLLGRDVHKYRINYHGKYLVFTRRGTDINAYSAIKKYLEGLKERLMPKPRDWKGDNWPGRKPGTYQWFEVQDSVDYYAEFEKPKIIVPAIVQRATFAYDPDGFYSNDKTTIIPTNDLYLLGILNSKVADFILKQISSTKQGGYFEQKPMYISQLPIHRIDFTNSAEKSAHDEIVKLVEQMLELHKQHQQAEAAQEDARFALQKRIQELDQEIDARVYRLYGLTEEEIKVVEGQA